MKRLLSILGAFLVLTACAKTGALLAPGVTNATAPSAETPPDTTTPPDGATTSSTGGTGTGTTTGTGTGDGGQFIHSERPIEPKSDPQSIVISTEIGELVRMHFGTNFEETFDPKAETNGIIPVWTDGKVHLVALAETKNSSDNTWQSSSTDCSVRMVYRSSDASALTKYCDATVLVDYSPEEGGNVLFSGVPAALGTFEFYHLIPIDPDVHKGMATLAGDPITSCASGWQTLDSEPSLAADWIYLGSMDGTIVPHKVTTHPTATPSNP